MSRTRSIESTHRSVEREGIEEALGPARDSLAFARGLALGLVLGSALVLLSKSLR
jgi:hypothetical protein